MHATSRAIGTVMAATHGIINLFRVLFTLLDDFDFIKQYGKQTCAANEQSIRTKPMRDRINVVTARASCTPSLGSEKQGYKNKKHDIANNSSLGFGVRFRNRFIYMIGLLIWLSSKKALPSR